MKILYLILFCIFGFGLYLIFQKKYRGSIIYTLAIGSIVNGTIFNALNYPIKIGNLTFGMDSVVYLLFLFSVVMMYAYYGKRDTVTLVICSVGAIIFAAFIEFITRISSSGYTPEVLLSLVSYIASCVAAIIACIAMIALFDFLRKKKVCVYANVIIVLIVASLVESFVFNACTSSFKISILTTQFWSNLLAMYIGKMISLAFCVATMLVVNLVFKEDKIPYPSKCEDKPTVENAEIDAEDTNEDTDE